MKRADPRRAVAVRAVVISTIIAALVPVAHAVNRGHIIKGFVTGVDGVPVQDAIVEVRSMDEQHERGEDVTDENGYYEIKDIPPGLWKVIAYEYGRTKVDRIVRCQGPDSVVYQDLQLLDRL